VTIIGEQAFQVCGLTSVRIPNNVTNIGNYAFCRCGGLTNVMIGTNVTAIGMFALSDCGRLTKITIPDSVTSIGEGVFYSCSNLTSVYFQGNAPISYPFPANDQFYADSNATVYYLPGTKGWGPTFGGRPTVLWNPQVQPGSLGVRTNQFGFTVTGSSGLVIVVEATTNLANPAWSPVHTNTLTGGSSYFSDPQWTNYPGRFYRLRSP
jgi:hypothetical protein